VEPAFDHDDGLADDGAAHGRSLCDFRQQNGGIARQRIGVQHGCGSTSSASGFLMCSLITRAIGRAPISSSSAET
jgi:hypothetical protein